MIEKTMTAFADGGAVREAVQLILQTAEALFDRILWEEIDRNMMTGISDGILSGADFVNGAMETVGRGAERVRGTESASGGRSVTQNIYLRDSDASPYRTARRIRRESEAIFRN